MIDTAIPSIIGTIIAIAISYTVARPWLRKIFPTSGKTTPTQK